MADFSGSFGVGKTSGSSKTSTTESGTSTTRRLSQGSLDLTQQMSQYFNQQLAGGSYFTPDQARADVRGAIDGLFNQYRNEALPQIYSAQSGAGSYNSSAAQQLADNAYAQTVAQAGQLTLQAILGYEQAAQQNRQSILQGLQIALGAETAGMEDTSYDTKSTSRTKSKGSSIGGSLGF